jgi:hypothetical protein
VSIGDDLLQTSHMLDIEGTKLSEKVYYKFATNFSYDFFIMVSIMKTLCIKPYCILTNKINSLDTALHTFVKQQNKLGCVTTMIQLNHTLNNKSSRG